MKRVFVLAFLTLSILSCKNNEETQNEEMNNQSAASLEEAVPDGQQLFKGEFIYLADAAVLTTKSDIYAVNIDEKMHQLNEAAEALKKTEFDMVTVVIHGTLSPNPLKAETGEGWDEMVTIEKIIEVSPANNASTIQAGKSIDIKDAK